MVNANEAWEVVKEVPIGTIVAWAAFVIAIISACVVGVTKLYKLFEKSHDLKHSGLEVRDMVTKHESLMNKMDKQLDEIKTTIKKVEEHEDTLSKFGNQLTEIKTILNKQEEADIKKMRHSIIKSGEEALLKGTMTIREYKSLCELYDIYHNEKKANGYVTSLMKKIDSNVEIVGKLNDDGEDIE